MKVLEPVENIEESGQDDSELDYDAVIEDRLDRLLARLDDDWNYVDNLQNVSVIILAHCIWIILCDCSLYDKN